MNDEFLTNIQEPPRPEFADALYERINQPMKPANFPAHRFALGAALAFLILLASLVFSPTVRTAAQNLIFQIGHLLISDEPTYAEQFESKINSGTPTAVPTASPEAVQWQPPPLLSLAEATSQAGFAAAEIEAVPEGFSLAARFVTLPDEEQAFTQITTTYRSGGRILTLVQRAYLPGSEPQELPAGDATVTPLKVQGVDGLWVEDLRLSTYVDENNQVAPQYANVLIWEKDGVEYWLQSSPGEGLEEMMGAANSVR